jgi:hypothetical protein
VEEKIQVTFQIPKSVAKSFGEACDVWSFSKNYAAAVALHNCVLAFIEHEREVKRAKQQHVEKVAGMKPKTRELRKWLNDISNKDPQFQSKG